MTAFKKTVLPNGIRVVSEKHPSARATALGVWVTTGTRDESRGEEGLSHFLEHLVFKGTKTRSAYQIARSLEALGGDLNAYTTKEYTCYHALVLKDHWAEAIDVLADLVENMKLAPRDFMLEKGVILQEIAMSEDNHEDIINDLLFERVYSDNALGVPILGTVKSIASMKRQAVMRRYRERYGGDQIIVSAAGPMDHDEVVEIVQSLLGRKKRSVHRSRRVKPKWKPIRDVVEKEGEQVHLLWALPAPGFRDEDRFEAFIVNAALGGGMTSRLYQAVREKKGLVYSIHSSLATFVDSGLITIYAAADLANVRAVGNVVAREVGKLKRRGLSRADLKLFKTQLTGSLLLGADDVENRMSSLGVNEMVFGRYRAVDEVVEEIRAIDEDRIARYLEKAFRPEKMAGLALGPGVAGIEAWWKELDFTGKNG